MTSTTIADSTWVGYISGDDGHLRERCTMRAALVHLAGNQRPYFSLTGDIHERPSPRSKWGDSTAGALRAEDYDRFFPPETQALLHTLEAIHLADDEGVPVHAEANAFYWAGLTHWQAPRPFHLARHLRVEVAEARRLIARAVGADGGPGSSEPTGRDVIAVYVEGCRPRWMTEARDALAVLDGTRSQTATSATTERIMQ